MEEIVEDILSRLPVKSLFRFKCVSKFCKTLISQTNFKKKHLNHSKNQLNLSKILFLAWAPERHLWPPCLFLVRLHEDIPIIFDCPSNPNPAYGMKIYSSCDGLFLIGIWTTPQVKLPDILAIWNPSTKEVIALPHSRFPRVISDDDDVYDYDYYVAEPIYGLAYDSISDDYKIFRIDLNLLEDIFEILALKNGSWRIIDTTSAGRISVRMLFHGTCCLAFIQGAFHWLGVLSSKFFLVSFNISNEMFGEIPLPEIVRLQLDTSMTVGGDVDVLTMTGKLGIYYKADETFHFWVMKNYGVEDSWMKLFTIPSSGVYTIIPKYIFNNAVYVCFRINRVTTLFAARMISGGYMSPIDYHEADADIIDGNGVVFTESLISPRDLVSNWLSKK